MAIFSSKLEIELNPCLGALVLRSPFALSKLLVAYRTGYGEASYYGAVFGHHIHGGSAPTTTTSGTTQAAINKRGYGRLRLERCRKD
jgi:hypothetical protein